MIVVHGLMGEPTQRLREEAAAADWVVGGIRHLDALAVPQQRRIVLGALRLAADRIASLPDDQQVVVIASGDPLFFGVVRTLRAHGLRPQVVSGPSSIAAAFAAVGLPWDDAVVVSIHGRPLAAAAHLAMAHPKVAVFTAAGHGIAELAAALAGVERWFVLAERLGEPDQRVLVLDAQQARQSTPAEPNVVLVLARHPDAPDSGWGGAVAGPARAQRPRVSAAAAVAFARLLPEPGELVWVQGRLAEEVASLAAWSGAAVEIVRDRPSEAAGPRTMSGQPPDLVLGEPQVVGPLLKAVTPRVAVLVGRPEPGAALPADYHWRPESVGEETITTGEPA